MGFILSIEDRYDITLGNTQPKVEPMRFVNWLIIEDNKLDIGIAQFIDFGLCFCNGARIIFTADGENLNQALRIVKIIDLLDRVAIDSLFMTSW